MSAVAVQNARHQWEEGYRRLREHANDQPLHQHLLAQVDVLLDELNRRVGQTFTLAELAGAYQDADRWLLEVLPPGSGAIQVGTGRGRRVPPLRPRRRRLPAMRPRPRRRRRHVGRWLVRAAALLVVLAIGIALGQTFDDSSAPSGTQTSVRTLEPATLTAETVTVTVTTTP